MSTVHIVITTGALRLTRHITLGLDTAFVTNPITAVGTRTVAHAARVIQIGIQFIFTALAVVILAITDLAVTPLGLDAALHDRFDLSVIERVTPAGKLIDGTREGTLQTTANPHLTRIRAQHTGVAADLL